MTDDDETSGRTAGSVVRSEERARVAFPVRVRGRVRLRKRVVTEEVTQTFTVRREVLEVEELPGDEPGTEPSRESQIVSTDPDDDGFDIVLHAEQVVPTIEVVPVERIRVRTRVVATDVIVSADLLREQVEVSTTSTDARTPTTATPGAAGAQHDEAGADDGGTRTTKEEHP
ncbi:DUF2382 domain-containing protein [Microlunatus flavus]|uniref:DUF2382 domain-containing protein n=1 Tax=Microlunatus flavus TaxID=1036181 RepID=A0A1H9A4J7_9ACTN|nr:DUF2382 domain-containing protein [Microlunatus flavus]SEP71397.1 protein of unknown function [Microlunatus flavus]